MPQKPVDTCAGKIVVTHRMPSGRVLSDREFGREYHNKDKPFVLRNGEARIPYDRCQINAHPERKRAL